MLTIEKFIREIPKAELHLHIEGSFEPELMFWIAQRNKIDIKYKSVEELKKAYQFNCLQDFLDIYYTGAKVLITEQDFYDLTMAYFEKCAEENILFTEIMFDPQTHTHRNVAFSTVINGIQKAREDAENKYGIQSLLIMSYLRHLSEEDAFITLEESLPFKHLIYSVGLDSSEKGNPPSKFKRVFAASMEAGYKVVAHAGEEGTSDYVWEALDLLQVQRIDHGNASLQDEALVEEIKKRDLALTVCPLSNLSLRVVSNLEDHPIRKMLDKGLKPTINSDDPAYFGGYLTENYLQLQKALHLTKTEIVELAKNGFRYSFASDIQKCAYLQQIDEFVANFTD